MVFLNVNNYIAGWTGEVPAQFHKLNHVGSIPTPATNLIIDFMDLKIETYFEELYTLRNVKFVPRVGEYISCAKGIFEVDRIMYTIDPYGALHVSVKVKDTNISQF